MTDEFDEKPMTLEEFNAFFSRLTWVPQKARDIASAIERRACDFEGFTEDGAIRYSYWDGCHCHGNNSYDSFAAELLFDDNAVAEIMARHEREKAEAAEKKRTEEEVEKARKEETDRKEFERLKEKYAKS